MSLGWLGGMSGVRRDWDTMLSFVGFSATPASDYCWYCRNYRGTSSMLAPPWTCWRKPPTTPAAFLTLGSTRMFSLRLGGGECWVHEALAFPPVVEATLAVSSSSGSVLCGVSSVLLSWITITGFGLFTTSAVGSPSPSTVDALDGLLFLDLLGRDFCLAKLIGCIYGLGVKLCII